MKRLGHVLEAVADHANLAEAFHKAARGKRHQFAVCQFEGNLLEELALLSTQLREGRFHPGKFHRFVVRDPKVRIIHAAPFRERVLHHAIMNVAGPWFERGAFAHSYACRQGKGNLAALQTARRYTTAKRFVIKLDIRRFFDSIDHAKLKCRLARLFKDRWFLQLLETIIDSYAEAPRKGLPIGTLTSQYFANVTLDPMDHWITSELGAKHYVRFMDDFVLWHDDAEFLLGCQQRIEEWLADTLKLRLKGRPAVAATNEGVEFLGYRLKPGRVLLGKRARERYRRCQLNLERDFQLGKISVEELQCRATSLLAFAEHASCRRWRRGLFAEHPFDLA